MSISRPETSSPASLSAQQLRKRYIVALSLIALLTIVSQIVVQLLILDQEHDSRIVNIAGRQRMLSQKISKLSLYIVNAESVAAASGFRAQLEDALVLWQRSHRGLQHGDAEMELPGRNSREVAALFNAIEPDHQAMVAATRTLLSSLGNETVHDQEIALIRKHEPLFLEGMNDIVFLYDREAKQKVAFARWLEVALLVVTLGVLMLEATFIFAPATRRIQSDMQALADREVELSIAATAFEAQEGMFITNADRQIIRVNKAFTAITGYTAAEAIGKTPALLRSDRHDAGFYAAMYDSIGRTGTWQGEIWNRRKNGESFPEWLTITAVKNGQGKLTHYVSTLTDITLRKAAESEIQRLAFYDPLTHLPNRRLLIDRLQKALALSARSQRAGALLFLDLDHFKDINDKLGHDKGDQLLQQVAARLSGCVREGDTVARLGGDEFVVMLENLSTDPGKAAAQAKMIGEAILAMLNQPYDLSGHACRTTPSIGIALFADHRDSIEDLMKRADLAMYEAKAAGRNTLRFFDAAGQPAEAG